MRSDYIRATDLFDRTTIAGNGSSLAEFVLAGACEDPAKPVSRIRHFWARTKEIESFTKGGTTRARRVSK